MNLTDYGIAGAVLLIVFGGIGYVIRWLLRQFQPPAKEGERGGVFWMWVDAHARAAEKVGDAMPQITLTQQTIADTQRIISESLAGHIRESTGAMEAIQSQALELAGLREAGMHACIVAEMVLSKLGLLEEGRPSLEKIRGILSHTAEKP